MAIVRGASGNPLRVGSKVEHMKYGIGKIVDISGYLDGYSVTVKRDDGSTFEVRGKQVQNLNVEEYAEGDAGDYTHTTVYVAPNHVDAFKKRAKDSMLRVTDLGTDANSHIFALEGDRDSRNRVAAMFNSKTNKFSVSGSRFTFVTSEGVRQCLLQQPVSLINKCLGQLGEPESPSESIMPKVERLVCAWVDGRLPNLAKELGLEPSELDLRRRYGA